MPLRTRRLYFTASSSPSTLKTHLSYEGQVCADRLLLALRSSDEYRSEVEASSSNLVRTLGFHPRNTGSNPVEVAFERSENRPREQAVLLFRTGFEKRTPRVFGRCAPSTTCLSSAEVCEAKAKTVSCGYKIYASAKILVAKPRRGRQIYTTTAPPSC